MSKYPKFLYISAAISVVSGILTIVSNLYPGIFTPLLGQADITGGTLSVFFNGPFFLLGVTILFGIIAAYLYYKKKNK